MYMDAATYLFWYTLFFLENMLQIGFCKSKFTPTVVYVRNVLTGNNPILTNEAMSVGRESGL